MSSIKQIQSRLVTRKNSLTRVNLNLANAEKSKNSIVLRRLIQEKGILDRDIKKLERLLIMEKKAAHEKKALDPYRGAYSDASRPPIPKLTVH